MTHSKEALPRREALKALAAATGAAAIASLPSRWVKPQINFGAIPAHAQTSGGITMSVTLEWTDESFFDYDLMIVDPDNTFTGYDPSNYLADGSVGPDSSTMTHSGDVAGTATQSESVTQIAPLLSGTYTILVNLREAGAPLATSATLTITLNGVDYVIDVTSVFSEDSTGNVYYGALVDIPSGVIDTSVLGDLYP